MPHRAPLALIAVPVKDEADRIDACLRAIALQAETAADAVILVVNNTSDGTAGIVRGLLPVLPVAVHVVEHDFPPETASAGAARRMGMEFAADMAGDGTILLTTDADGRVPPDWVAANLYHIRNGADAVAGRAVLDPADAALIPAKLHADDALECAYAAALDEIAALVDPSRWDPWPRHMDHAGASIAVTLEAYRGVGGMPAAALAEDRRFFAALERIDARVRHAPEIEVAVSGRIVGRAEGGMADTIRRRLSAPDPYLDDSLEPAAAHLRRVRLRARFRRIWQACGRTEAGELSGLAAALGVPGPTVRLAAGAAYCGEGWAMLSQAAAEPAWRLVPADDVTRELEAALRILAGLCVETEVATPL